MTWRPRRVVTGHDGRGRSIVISDGPPPVIRTTPEGDAAFAEIWSTGSMPAPVSGDEPEPTLRTLKVPPEPNGTVVRLVELRPGMSSPMHRTETIDYGVVLEGEVYLVLDGSETRLEQGAVVVQRGTDHAWQNRSVRPARMLFVLVDGRFSDELGAALGPDALGRLYDAPLEQAGA